MLYLSTLQKNNILSDFRLTKDYLEKCGINVNANFKKMRTTDNLHSARYLNVLVQTFFSNKRRRISNLL